MKAIIFTASLIFSFSIYAACKLPKELDGYGMNNIYNSSETDQENIVNFVFTLNDEMPLLSADTYVFLLDWTGEDYDTCRPGMIKGKSFSTSGGKTYYAFYTSNDDCDGGNALGAVTDTNHKLIASFNSEDNFEFYCEQLNPKTWIYLLERETGKMKTLLIIALTIFALNSWAGEIQTCGQIGDISGKYTTSFEVDVPLTGSDEVDTVFTAQKEKMTYTQVDIENGEIQDEFDVKLMDTHNGCEVSGDNFIITRLGDNKLQFTSADFMFYLLKH